LTPKEKMAGISATNAEGSYGVIVPTVILLQHACRPMWLTNVLEYLEMYSKFTTQHEALCQSLLNGRTVWL